MKKTLLLFLMVFVAVTTTYAKDFVWGTATWNIEDGKVYNDIDDLKAEGIVLTYPNPTNYTLTFFHMLAVEYNLYVDGAEEPIQANASAQQGTAVQLDYPFVEGHSYRIVTTKALLAKANLATYSTDTLSINEDSYTISFEVKGPEVVKTIDVDGTMALTITDQNAELTYSLVDTVSIIQALGIASVAEAEVYGLNVNGSYNPYFIDPFDGWHDADGEYTVYSGNNSFIYEIVGGHNPYPPVYCVKLNATCDTVSYFFYDSWKIYDPDDPGEVPSSSGKRRAPQTSYNNIVWDWEWIDGDGQPQVTQYLRSYRVDEGSDYKASFIVKANKKAAIINATLHFVSQEAYAAYIAASVKDVKNTSTQERPVAIYSPNGVSQSSLQKGFNIIRNSDGTTRKLWVK